MLIIIDTSNDYAEQSTSIETSNDLLKIRTPVDITIWYNVVSLHRTVIYPSLRKQTELVTSSYSETRCCRRRHWDLDTLCNPHQNSDCECCPQRHSYLDTLSCTWTLGVAYNTGTRKLVVTSNFIKTWLMYKGYTNIIHEHNRLFLQNSSPRGSK